MIIEMSQKDLRTMDMDMDMEVNLNLNMKLITSSRQNLDFDQSDDLDIWLLYCVKIYVLESTCVFAEIHYEKKINSLYPTNYLISLLTTTLPNNLPS